MQDIPDGLWSGRFSFNADDGDNWHPCVCQGDALLVPLRIEDKSVYRFFLSMANAGGNGLLSMSLRLGNGNGFSPVSMSCPPGRAGWGLFAVDVATGRVPGKAADAFLRVAMEPSGTGGVMIRRVSFDRLSSPAGQRHAPLLVATEPCEKNQSTTEQGDMENLDQGNWRSRDTTSRPDERGVKCHSMDGERSMLLVPVKVKPNTAYCCHLELKRESGNGKLYCNFYANRNFDFPHVPLLCEGGAWNTYDIMIRTGAFPANLPVVLRLWRFPSGTGSLLVRRIVLEQAQDETMANGPRPVVVAADAIRLEPATAKTAARTQAEVKQSVPAPASVPRPHPAESKNRFGPVKSRLLVLTGDDAVRQRTEKTFGGGGFAFDMLVLDPGSESSMEEIRNFEPDWIHVDPGSHPVLPEAIDYVRTLCPHAAVTAYASRGKGRPDQEVAEMFGRVDVGLVGGEDELAACLGIGCRNVEIWDSGADMDGYGQGAKDGRVLLVRDGCLDGSLFAALSNEFGPGLSVADSYDSKAFGTAGAIVYPGCSGFSTGLVEALASGIPVVASRKPWMGEWFEDGTELSCFDTPEECIGLVRRQLKAPSTGRAGRCAAGWHSLRARMKELAARIGLPEAVADDFSKERITGPFTRILCVAADIPPELGLAHSKDGRRFLGVSFGRPHSLLAKALRFRPDWIHLCADLSGTWRDELLETRRRLPRALVTASCPEAGPSGDLAALADVVDQVLAPDKCALAECRRKGFLEAIVWHPIGNGPAAFRDSLMGFAPGLGASRKQSLKSPSGKPVEMSVFMGTYNRLESLKAAVGAILDGAGSRAIEVIVNDAGSTDGTGTWLAQEAAKDERVVAVFTGRKTSFTQAFNDSIRIAKGKYISWLSDDIVAEPQAVPDMCGLMDSLQPLDMGAYPIKNSWDSKPHSVFVYKGKFLPSVGSMCVETLRRTGGMNTDFRHYAQDAELSLRTMRLGGGIFECPSAKLDHFCKSDALRLGNLKAHAAQRGDDKFALYCRERESACRFPFPAVMLVPMEGASHDSLAKALAKVRRCYANAHCFLGDPCAQMAEALGLAAVPASFGSACDIVIHVRGDCCELAKPENKKDFPIVKENLCGRLDK
jgi:hypothetical protein